MRLVFKPMFLEPQNSQKHFYLWFTQFRTKDRRGDKTKNKKNRSCLILLKNCYFPENCISAA